MMRGRRPAAGPPVSCGVVDRGAGRRLATQQGLQQRGGFGQLAFAGEAGRLEHGVREDRVHVWCLRCADAGLPWSQAGSPCIPSWNADGGSGWPPCRRVAAVSGMRCGLVRSAGAVGERGLHRGAGLQRAQDGDRGDRRLGEFRRDIGGDAGKSQHPDVEPLSRGTGRFEIRAAEMPQPEIEAFPGDRLPGRVGVPFDLIADRGADEVRAVRVEAVLDQQVDMAEIDVAEVDGDLFGIAAGLGPQLVTRCLPSRSIPLPSVWMVNGGWPSPSRRRAHAGRCRFREPTRVLGKGHEGANWPTDGYQADTTTHGGGGRSWKVRLSEPMPSHRAPALFRRR